MVPSDGDRITVQSDLEWQECKREQAASSTLRLFAVQGSQPYFKDGPPAQVVGFYDSATGDRSSAAPDAERADVARAVPRCLARLFPNAKVLPHNLPAWLGGAVRATGNGSAADVDLDVDLVALWAALSARALALFEQGELEAARDLLAGMTEWKADSHWAWYNLACAHALLGDTDDALLALQCAFDAGYSNVAHALKDPDLESIRRLPGFTQLLNSVLEKVQ